MIKIGGGGLKLVAIGPLPPSPGSPSKRWPQQRVSFSGSLLLGGQGAVALLTEALSCADANDPSNVALELAPRPGTADSLFSAPPPKLPIPLAMPHYGASTSLGELAEEFEGRVRPPVPVGCSSSLVLTQNRPIQKL